MNIEEAQERLARIRYNEKELKVELGKDRYETIVREVKDIIARNGLSDFNTYHLFSHLADISRLERIHV